MCGLWDIRIVLKFNNNASSQGIRKPVNCLYNYQSTITKWKENAITVTLSLKRATKSNAVLRYIYWFDPDGKGIG